MLGVGIVGGAAQTELVPSQGTEEGDGLANELDAQVVVSQLGSDKTEGDVSGVDLFVALGIHLDDTGKVTIVGGGSATITAVTESGLSSSYRITVREPIVSGVAFGQDTYQGYGAVETEEDWYEPIEVEPVEGISKDFSMGMDISTIQNVLEGGGKFYNSEGNLESIYKLLRDNGFTYIRLRLWNEPYQYDAEGNRLSYGGGMCDVDTIKEIAVDAKGLGFKLLLNFHC